MIFDTHIRNGLQLVWGWQPYGGGYRSVAQSKQDDLCVISGLIRSGSWGYFGIVGGWCNPSQHVMFSCNNHEHVMRVDVYNNAHIYRADGTASHGWVSLDGIAYTTNGGNDISLYNGWGNYWNGWRPARWQRVGSICVLSGLMTPGGWSSHITNLPSSCRPRKRLVFGVNAGHYNTRIDVTPDGNVYYISHGRYGYVPLDGIRFIAQ
jgi:hypothetical protein